jgi:hypothetical protein
VLAEARMRLVAGARGRGCCGSDGTASPDRRSFKPAA